MPTLQNSAIPTHYPRNSDNFQAVQRGVVRFLHYSAALNTTQTERGGTRETGLGTRDTKQGIRDKGNRAWEPGRVSPTPTFWYRPQGRLVNSLEPWMMVRISIRSPAIR